MMREFIETLSLALPLVSSASVAVLALAVHRYARARSLAELAATATSKGATFVGLILMSLAIQTVVIPDARTIESFVLMTLVAAGAGLAANVAMARLCEQAATAIEDQGALPEATARGPT
jgi:hypothetical protein